MVSLADVGQSDSQRLGGSTRTAIVCYNLFDAAPCITSLAVPRTPRECQR